MSYLEQAVRLAERGLPKLAMPLFLAATRESPDDPEVWLRAGRTALDVAQPETAAELLQEALRLDPANRRAASKLVIARLLTGEYEGAAALCHRVLALDPENVHALVILGNLSYVLGSPEQAGPHYSAAFEIERQHGSTRMVSVYARLIRGDYAGTWSSLRPDADVAADWLACVEPRWRGEIAADRTVCLHSCGGIGDVLMWVRYAPLIAERVGRVVVAAPPSLDRLLQSVDGLAGVVREPPEATGALYVHALQLLAVFGTTPDTVPASFPYLRAPVTGPELPPRSRFRVGLAWAGNPLLWTDPDRSVPSAGLLQPLLAVPEVEWVSLQVGAREEWADELAIAVRPSLADFADTAYVLNQLDLVITVDTAVANLALAMGRPTWVLPPTYPDFRWGNPELRSPWYPAARLFRRAHTGEWEGVIARVAEALRAKVAEHHRVEQLACA